MKLPDIKDPSIDLYYLEGIRFGKKTIIDQIYREYFPGIQSMVIRNSGSKDDAKDIFQEILMVVYYNTQKKDFHLSCKFGTYLFSIARNLWLKHLNKAKASFTMTVAEDVISDSEELEEIILQMQRYQLYQDKFKEIGEQCQEILLLYMQGVDMKSIAIKMGFASESYAKKRKFKCKEQLISKIEQDKVYKEIAIRG